jgi:anti-sigma B factor antagonist
MAVSQVYLRYGVGKRMKSNTVDQILTFYLADKLIMSNSDTVKNSIKREVDEVLRQTSLKTVTIDLKDVEFIDSTGVGVFISIYKFLIEKQISFKIIHPKEIVNKVFTITKLGNIIDIEL